MVVYSQTLASMVDPEGIVARIRSLDGVLQCLRAFGGMQSALIRSPCYGYQIQVVARQPSSLTFRQLAGTHG